MTDNNPNATNQYQSETTARGDRRATPVEEPASVETPIDVTAYRLNHPKAYIGYTIALSKTGGDVDRADELTSERVVNMPDTARVGATNLGLVTDGPTPTLTTRGQVVAQRAGRLHDGLDGALDLLESLKGTHKRFTDFAPKWKAVGPYIAMGDPSVAYLVPLLQDLHNEQSGPFVLPDLVSYLLERDPDFTIELFIRDTQRARDRISMPDIRPSALQETDSYRASTTYQLKNLLYHLGVLTERGADTNKLDPATDEWQLTDRLR